MRVSTSVSSTNPENEKRPVAKILWVIIVCSLVAVSVVKSRHIYRTPGSTMADGGESKRDEKGHDQFLVNHLHGKRPRGPNGRKPGESVNTNHFGIGRRQFGIGRWQILPPPPKPTDLICPAGRYVAFIRNSNSWQCEKCAVGMYKATASNVGSCTVCPAGTYSEPNLGGTVCNPCALGQYAPERTVTSYGWECELCGVGEYNNATGASLCKQCPLDTYSETRGAIFCTACPPSSLTYAVGSTSHSDCMPPRPPTKLWVKKLTADVALVADEWQHEVSLTVPGSDIRYDHYVRISYVVSGDCPAPAANSFLQSEVGVTESDSPTSYIMQSLSGDSDSWTNSRSSVFMFRRGITYSFTLDTFTQCSSGVLKATNWGAVKLEIFG